MSEYRNQLESRLKTLDVKADYVIDWGGEQGHVNKRVKNWNVKKYDVWDLPDHDIESLPPTHIAKDCLADVIFCLEVFEYLICPDLALYNINVFLKKGGKAYISAPLVYPVHNEVELDALRYTENGLKRLVENAGMEVSNVWYRRDKSGILQAFYSADGMHPAKGMQHDITGYIIEVTK